MTKDYKPALEIITKELRVLYYNNYLLKHGVITSREHSKMNLAILAKCGKNGQKQAFLINKTF